MYFHSVMIKEIRFKFLWKTKIDCNAEDKR